jgi:hypothetical protein
LLKLPKGNLQIDMVESDLMAEMTSFIDDVSRKPKGGTCHLKTYESSDGSVLEFKIFCCLEFLEYHLRISSQRLEREIIPDNKPLRGGNLLIHHISVQVQDDSK